MSASVAGAKYVNFQPQNCVFWSVGACSIVHIVFRRQKLSCHGSVILYENFHLTF